MREPRIEEAAAVRYWPYLLVTLAVGWAFGPTLVGDAHLPYDAELYHFPILRSVHDALAGGAVPAWNPYSYGGTPLLANAQSAWAYPPHLLLSGVLAAVGQPLRPGTLNVLAVGHVWLAASTTALLARRRGIGDPGAAFAGVFVTLFGATVAQAQHIGMTETFAWLPLGLLAVDRLASGVTVGRVATLAILVALMITPGFLPLVPACALLLLGSTVARGQGRMRALTGTVAGLVLGTLFAAAALLPVVGLLGVTPPLDPHPSLPLSSLLTTIFPNAFGHWLPNVADYTGPNGLTNAYNYVGAGALLLLPIALASGRQWRSDAVLAILLLVATFGTTGTAIADAVYGIGDVGAIYRPEMLGYVAALPLALVLARGLSRPPSLTQLGVGVVFLAVLSAIGFDDGAGHRLHLLADAPRRELLVLGVTAALLAAATVAAIRAPKAAPVLMALAACAASAELASTVPDRYFINGPGPATPVDAASAPGDPRVLPLLRDGLEPGERVAADIARLPAEWNGFPPIWRLPDTNGFQPQFSRFQLDRVKALGVDFGGQNRIFPIRPELRPYLDELGVRYVVVGAATDSFAGRRGYRRVFLDGTYAIYDIRGARPRAAILDPACLARRGVAHLVDCREPGRVSVFLKGRSTRVLTLPGAASAAGQLVSTGEPWYPGWRASAPDGSRVPVERLGYLAALRVPKDRTVVELRYRPPGLIGGLLISALSIGAVCGWLGLGWRRRRRTRSDVG